jgi:hypothetical protein
MRARARRLNGLSAYSAALQEFALDQLMAPRRRADLGKERLRRQPARDVHLCECSCSEKVRRLAIHPQRGECFIGGAPGHTLVLLAAPRREVGFPGLWRQPATGMSRTPLLDPTTRCYGNLAGADDATSRSRSRRWDRDPLR